MHKDDTPWIVAQQQSRKSESQNSALLYLVVSCVVNLLFLGSLCFQHGSGAPAIQWSHEMVWALLTAFVSAGYSHEFDDGTFILDYWQFRCNW